MFSILMQIARREIAEWRKIRDIRELAKLSDSQLDDIGLGRDQLFMLEAQEPEAAPERWGPAPVFQPGLEPCG